MIKLSEMLYCEINALCIFILGIILYKIKTGIDKRRVQDVFTAAIINTLCFFIMDFIWGLVSLRIWDVSRMVCYIINCLYFLFSGSVAVHWYLYIETELESEFIKDKKWLGILCIPVAILSILAVMTFKTDWIFSVNIHKVYARGKYHFIQELICYTYIICACIHAVIRALKSNNEIQRSQYFKLISFTLLPLGFGMVQKFSKGIPTLCAGLTIGILQAYIHSMNQLISIDTLTQLNNRNQLISYLTSLMKTKNEKIYLLIIDVDEFKQINDNYGHIVGDQALAHVALVLKKVSMKQQYFVARYGGDEFILLCEAENEAEIDQLCMKIQDLLMQMNEEKHISYKLTVSMGYAQYTKDIQSIPEFIDLADIMLYRMKETRKKKLLCDE